MSSTFGHLTDYFALASGSGSPLMLVSASSGATRSVTATAGSTGSGTSLRNGHLAIGSSNSAVGGFSTGPVLLNPVCTYRIKRSGTVPIKLGKAYGAATVQYIGDTVTESGFMLVAAEYSTGADGEPVLVIRGAANEGYEYFGGRKTSRLTDAINLWTVNLAVSPYHIAQDPMSAVGGGGELTECRTSILCDPVVPMENGCPCASDIVKGRVLVSATTNAYDGENPPVANSPYMETGLGTDDSDVDFTTYHFTAERSL